MDAQIMEEFAAGRATNFKEDQETSSPAAVAQEAAITARILLTLELTRNHRRFGRGLV
jgi:hypothetical protein